MSRLVLTRGIPASGKSTFAREWVTQGPDRVRVNRDDIRRMLFQTVRGTRLTHGQEMLVTRVEHDTALHALRSGRDVIVDAMNLRARYVRAWMGYGFPVEFVDFPVSLEDALARNTAREDPVPRFVIRDAFTRFTPRGKLPPVPTLADPVLAPYEPNWDRPTAWLIDIDGTLAHNTTGRGWYDYARVGEDTIDVAVREVVNALHETHVIILLSGRAESCRPETEAWLKTNFVPYDDLLMRTTGDTRSDQVVKPELFTRVRDAFNVLGVIDDRPSVCRMWRALGVKTFQVGDPAIEF